MKKLLLSFVFLICVALSCIAKAMDTTFEGEEKRGSTITVMKKEDTFEKLPDEIVLRIFSDLSLKEVIKLGNVSKRFYFLAWDGSLWRIFINMHIPQMQENLIQEDKEGWKKAVRDHLAKHELFLSMLLKKNTTLLKKEFLNADDEISPLVRYVVDELVLNAHSLLTLGTPPEIIRENLELLSQLETPWVLNMLLHALAYGNSGYSENKTKARDLLIKYVNEGHEWAARSYFDGLNTGQYGLEINKTALKEFCEQHKDKEWAWLYSINGLNRGDFGYERDPGKAKKRIEKELRREGGFFSVRELQFEGLLEGKYGFEHNEDEALKILEIRIIERTPWALGKVIELWEKGRYAAEKVHALIDTYYKAGTSEASEYKISGLLEGNYGYKVDFGEAHRLIDSEISKRASERATQLKYYGLVHGQNGYIKSEDQASTFLLSEAEKGNQWAIQEFLIRRHRETQSVKSLIDSLIENKRNPEVYGLVAFNFWLGMMDYPKDVAEAIAFVKRHHVNPFAIITFTTR